MSNPFQSLEISASALSAERSRVAVIMQNIANASTLPSAPGQAPYRRQTVVFETILNESQRRRGDAQSGGVRVKKIEADTSPFPRLHRPGHPAASPQGWVESSNVELPMEMVDLMDASRSYEANLTALRMMREMLEQALQITR